MTIKKTYTIEDTEAEKIAATEKFFALVEAGKVGHNALLYRPAVNLDRLERGEAMTPVEMDTLCRLAFELLATYLEVNSGFEGIDEYSKPA